MASRAGATGDRPIALTFDDEPRLLPYSNGSTEKKGIFCVKLLKVALVFEKRNGIIC